MGKEPARGARTGRPWGGAGWCGCRHRHHHLAALQPPSQGRLGNPFPSGTCYQWHRRRRMLELAVRQYQPLRARAWSLAAAPL